MSYEANAVLLTAKRKSSSGMIFRGKVDWWFYGIMILIAVILIPIIVTAFMGGMTGAAVVDLLVLAVIEGFCGLIVWRNYVRLETRGIVIVFGLIQLGDSLRRYPCSVRDPLPLSSLAASLDRIEIRYGNGGMVMIAVVEKQAFFRGNEKTLPGGYGIPAAVAVKTGKMAG